MIFSSFISYERPRGTKPYEAKTPFYPSSAEHKWISTVCLYVLEKKEMKLCADKISRVQVLICIPYFLHERRIYANRRTL